VGRGNADADALSRDRRRAEGEEDDVDEGGDVKNDDGRVRGPRRADTGDGRRGMAEIATGQ